jgi:conserved oligomeric Golgi complex subunit 8
MAESLLQLLEPHLKESNTSDETPRASIQDEATIKYLNRLTTLQLGSLNSTEPQSLSQSLHSTIRSLQAISTRSSKTLVTSADELNTLQKSIPRLAIEAGKLREGISTLDNAAIKFAEKYSRSGENEVLDRRKRALLMSRNVDRVSEVLDLPTLLSSAINASTGQNSAAGSNYASALDLHSHIKRLRHIYPDSYLVRSVSDQAESSMQEMKTNLIISLKSQNIKLAAGMRTIGWLRRIAPELGNNKKDGINSKEGSYGALFLVCRLANLLSMLDALSPLRFLADAETEKRLSLKEPINANQAWSGGQQTERYLKRYIEIFREQSFAIVSMFRSIFPTTEPGSAEDLGIQLKSLGLKSPMPTQTSFDENDPLQPLPSALTTFPLHLVSLLSDTLKHYLPNVRDKSSRESLLTQVLYCAGSLGRLGGDFSMILADLEDDTMDDLNNWVGAMKKHKVLAGRLESMASGQKETNKLGAGEMSHRVK